VPDSAPAPADGTVRRFGRVRNFRLPAIVATVVFPFTGVVALVHSLRSSRRTAAGDIEGGRLAGARARDWCWYSLGYGLFVYFIGFVVLLFTIRDAALIKVYFDDVMFDGSAWRSLLKGFWINIQVFLWAEVIVLPWALLVAVVRQLPGRACAPIRWVAIAYCDSFRALPAILAIFIINYGFQEARLPLLENLSSKQYAILALVLVYGAYVSEVYRAGIESIHPSQVAAARSLGLSYGQTMRHVVIPPAVRRMTPALMNDFIGLQKDTALLSTIGVLELLSRARFLNNSQATFTGYTMAAMLFFALTIPLTRMVDYLQRRAARVDQAPGDEDDLAIAMPLQPVG